MQDPRWGCRYCGAEVLTQGGRHPTDPAANAVAAPKRSSARAGISTPKSQRKPVAKAKPKAPAAHVDPSSDSEEDRPPKLFSDSEEDLPLYGPQEYHPSSTSSDDSSEDED